MRVPAICSLAVLLVAAGLQAQEAKHPPGKPGERPGPEMVFDRWDGNHDGFLTAEELPPPLRQQLAQADKNGDKKLDPSEFAGLWKDRPRFLPPEGPMAGPPRFAGRGPGGGFGCGAGPGGPPGGPPPGGPFAKPPHPPGKPSEAGPKGSPAGDVQQERPSRKGPPRDGEALRALFKRLDRDGNGQLSYEEFAAGAARLLRGPVGPAAFGPAGFGPRSFSPPGFGPTPFSPPGFGPRPPRPFGPFGVGPASHTPSRAAWWHRGLWPGMRHAMLHAAWARPRGPWDWTPWGAWARFGPRLGSGGFGPRWRPMGPPPWAGGGASALMARFDTDHDGKLSRTEAPPRLAERFDRIDRNHDGLLTPEELRAAARETFKWAKPRPWPGEKPPKAKPPADKPKDKPPPDKPAKDQPAKAVPPKDK